MNYVFLGIHYVLIPVLKVIVPWGIKKLKTAKDGIPKDIAITVLDAVAESTANNSTPDMFKPIMEILDAS